MKLLNVGILLVALQVMGINPAWGIDPKVLKDFEREIPRLFMDEEGGPEFVMEDGELVAKVYELESGTLKPVFSHELPLGDPEVVKEYFRLVINRDLLVPTASSELSYENQRLLGGAIRILGSLKDQSAQPLLRKILADRTIDKDNRHRDDAIDALLAIDFEGNLETIIREVLDPPNRPENSGIGQTAFDALVVRATPQLLDRLAEITERNKIERARIYRMGRIAERRAELEKKP